MRGVGRTMDFRDDDGGGDDDDGEFGRPRLSSRFRTFQTSTFSSSVVFFS